MTEVMAEDRQTTARSASGKSAPFEGEEVDSSSTRASNLAPIDRCTVRQVGEFKFVLVEPDGSLFDVNAAIEKAFNSGQCK